MRGGEENECPAEMIGFFVKKCHVMPCWYRSDIGFRIFYSVSYGQKDRRKVFSTNQATMRMDF